MGSKANTFEGQTSGTTWSIANSGGGSGDAFDTRSVSGTTPTAIFDNAQAASGSQSLHITGVATSILRAEWNTNINGTVAEASCCIRIVSASAAAQDLFSIRSGVAGAGQVTVFGLSSTRQLQLKNAAGSLLQTFAILSLNTWYQINIQCIPGTTTGNGYIRGWYSLLNSSPAETPFSSAAVNAGTSNVTGFWIGKHTSAPTLEAFFDNAVITSTVAAASGDGAATGSVVPAVAGSASGDGATTGTTFPVVAGSGAGSGAATGLTAPVVVGSGSGSGSATGSTVATVTGTSSGAGAATALDRPVVSGSAGGAGAATAATVETVTGTSSGTGAQTGTVATVISGAASGAGSSSATVADQVSITGTSAGTGAATGLVLPGVTGTASGSGAALVTAFPVYVTLTTGGGGDGTCTVIPLTDATGTGDGAATVRLLLGDPDSDGKVGAPRGRLDRIGTQRGRGLQLSPTRISVWRIGKPRGHTTFPPNLLGSAYTTGSGGISAAVFATITGESDGDGDSESDTAQALAPISVASTGAATADFTVELPEAFGGGSGGVTATGTAFVVGVASGAGSSQAITTPVDWAGSGAGASSATLRPTHTAVISGASTPTVTMVTRIVCAASGSAAGSGAVATVVTASGAAGSGNRAGTLAPMVIGATSGAGASSAAFNLFLLDDSGSTLNGSMVLA